MLMSILLSIIVLLLLLKNKPTEAIQQESV